jgi:hypothetical protein
LLNNLQIHKAPTLPAKIPETPMELLYSGSKIFVDAAWTKGANGQPSKARSWNTYHLKAWPTYN